MRGIVLWTIIVVVVASILILAFLPRDVMVTGTDIEVRVNASDHLDVSTQATASAASTSFFLFRKETGEVVVGTPAPKPLGWQDDTYFTTADSVVMATGEWIVQDGHSITVHLTSQDSLSVTVKPDPGRKTAVVVIIVIFAIAGWVMSALAAIAKHD